MKKVKIALISFIILMNFSSIVIFKGNKVKALMWDNCIANQLCIDKVVYDKPSSSWEETTSSFPGGTVSFNIAISNRSTSTLTNIKIKDILPAGLNWTGVAKIYDETGGHDIDGTNLFNNTGYVISSLMPSQDRQIVFTVTSTTSHTPGTVEYTNTVNVTTAQGNNISDTASVTVTYTELPTNPGDVLINEVNTNPRADWSTNVDHRLSSRGDINNQDQFIEFYIKKAGLDLSNANWKLRIENEEGSLSEGQLLTMTSTVYQYVGTGTINNTSAGDYIILMSPSLVLAQNGKLEVKFDTTTIDTINFSGSNTGLFDETLGRNATSTDTDNDGADFTRNHATPGMANTPRVVNIYEAEIYTPSYTGNEHGVDIIDAAASRGVASQLSAALDKTGIIYEVYTNDHRPAGAYRITLRLKTLNADLNGTNPIVEFNATYPNGSVGSKNAGYAIRGRDITANNAYQDFTIEFYKPATTDTNRYMVGYFPATGTNVVIDYISVEQIAPSNTLPIVYEGENMHFKAGYRYNDGGTNVAFGPKGEAAGGTHMTYGPYVANHIVTPGTQTLNATFRLKFQNISGSSTDPVARIDIYDSQQGLYRERILRVGNVTNSYADYTLQFPTAHEGSFEFRVINYGNADIYFDKVTITAGAPSGTIIYESENDFEYPNNASIVVDTNASNNQGVVSTVASNAEGYMLKGPFALDQTGTGKYYQAEFRLRTSATSSLNTVAAYIFVRNIDTREILNNMPIYANVLNSEFRTFKLFFPSPTSGRLSYEVYFTDQVDVYSDYVKITELAGNSDPRTIETEELYRWVGNGVVVEDSLASNDIGHTTGLAVRATNGADDNSVIIYSNSQEIFNAGSYNIDFYVRRTAGSGVHSDIAYLEVWDENEGFKGYYSLKEDELSNSTYGSFRVPITKSSSGRIYYKIYFIGGLSNSILIDKIISDRI